MGDPSTVMGSIPTIDLALYTGKPEDIAKLSHQLCDTLRTVGFMYVKNHGVSSALVSEFCLSSFRRYDI